MFLEHFFNRLLLVDILPSFFCPRNSHSEELLNNTEILELKHLHLSKELIDMFHILIGLVKKTRVINALNEINLEQRVAQHLMPKSSCLIQTIAIPS